MSFKNLIRQHPLTRKLVNTLNPFNLSVPPGHFYSPVPDINEVKKNADKIFNSQKPVLGTLKIEADTSASLEQRLVKFSTLKITEANFQTLSKEQTREIVAAVEKTIPDEDRVIALDRLL